VVGRDVNAGDKSVDALSSELKGAVAKVLVEDLTTAHTNVLIRLEGVSDVDFNSGWGDEVHLTDLLVRKRGFGEFMISVGVEVGSCQVHQTTEESFLRLVDGESIVDRSHGRIKSTQSGVEKIPANFLDFNLETKKHPSRRGKPSRYQSKLLSIGNNAHPTRELSTATQEQQG
jgi:hypothetical protein